MSTVTAHILVGQTHPYHGGITPSHRLYLHENSRPVWTLLPEVSSYQKSLQSEPKNITWIPTIENMLEDALLMIALHVEKDKEVLELARNYFKNSNLNKVELYQDIDQLNLAELNKKCRTIMFKNKITVSIFEGSSVRNQISYLEHYLMDVEVCISNYLRFRSIWDGNLVVRGTLLDSGHD